MTPIHFQKMKEYIGIDVEPCFSRLDKFKAYIYSKIVNFNPSNIYVTERGPNSTSLDYFLYKIAIKEGVEFEFSHILNTETINSIPSGSIIATGSYSCLLKDLKLGYTPFVHFDSYMKRLNVIKTSNFYKTDYIKIGAVLEATIDYLDNVFSSSTVQSRILTINGALMPYFDEIKEKLNKNLLKDNVMED